MSRPVLLLVTGPPCSGKTTIATRLSIELRLPVIGKDVIKELLFDTLGWKDRDWSRRLGHSSIEILFAFVEALLNAGQSIIVDCNFRRDMEGPRIDKLSNQYSARVLEIHCNADSCVLLERFRTRAQTGERHPGHGEELQSEEFEANLQTGVWNPLRISNELLEVDTTRFERVDFAGIVSSVSLTLS